jgi:PAS domain S-box-containing protein
MDFHQLNEDIGSLFPSADAFVAIDYHFCFLYLNEKAEKFYKKSKAELIGKKVKDVFPEQWYSGPFKNTRQNIIAKKPIEINYNTSVDEGWVELTGRPFENYYTLTYRNIDHKESLKDEWRKEVGKSSFRT